ncbi:hypothetical protein VUR80DRAFT_9967 [Thermomyces stellatus]
MKRMGVGSLAEVCLSHKMQACSCRVFRGHTFATRSDAAAKIDNFSLTFDCPSPPPNCPFVTSQILLFTTHNHHHRSLNPPHFSAMTTGGPQPTHYAVLAISPTLLTTSPQPAALLKQAYHRALLQNHPDKHRSAPPYTVDQISAAYRTLSSPALRQAYDAELRSAADTAKNEAFKTGVENVDLDDLEYSEEEGTWYRGCRCGNERGFSFGEGDLEGAEREGEVVVGCCDCSLWLRVHFAVVEG